MTASQFIAALLYSAIGQSPRTADYLEVDDEGNRTEAFYARCQMYYIAVGGE